MLISCENQKYYRMKLGISGSNKLLPVWSIGASVKHFIPTQFLYPKTIGRGAIASLVEALCYKSQKVAGSSTG
jgi:hypothetical protein